MTDTLAALLKALEAGDYSAFPMLLDHLEEIGDHEQSSYLRFHLDQLSKFLHDRLNRPALVTVQHVLNVGDLVVAVPPFALVSGSGCYSDAVVANVDPLVLISRKGDMLWRSTVTRKDIRWSDRASDDVMRVVMRRYNQEYPPNWAQTNIALPYWRKEP